MKRKLEGLMSLSALIGMVLLVLIAGALAKSVTDNTIGIANTQNVTGVTAAVIVLLPAILFITIIVSMVKEV